MVEVDCVVLLVDVVAAEEGRGSECCWSPWVACGKEDECE